MAAVLGVSAYYHDAAAALVVDGEIVAAIQEERLSRIKNDPGLPRRAMRACLELAGIDAGALDRVVFYEDPYSKLERVLVSVLRTFPRSFRQFPRAMGAQLGQKLWVVDQLAETLGLPRKRVCFVQHHESHAASAFFTSPFEEAAILTVDGVGENASTALWKGDADGLTCLATVDFPHSLGLFYAGLTAYLGFRVNEGEYKVMGLAAYGEPTFAEELQSVLSVRDDGGYGLDLSCFANHTDVELGFGPALERLLGPRRSPSRPWDLDSAEDRRYADIAASTQQALEHSLLALSNELRRRTGCDALCLAGGVALNCVANAKLQADSGFSRMFVHPAAGDAGGALGAAILGALQEGDPRPGPLRTAALGLPVAVERASTIAEGVGLGSKRVDDPSDAIAKDLAAGRIIGMASGRFEWGPRALGQRSILASPHDLSVRKRINEHIKKRQPFRPFAPAVLASSGGDWFEGAPNELTRFMTSVCPVRKPDTLAAVTHVDGTARVQTVDEVSAPALCDVLNAVQSQSGIPVVLNTSLNGPGEPIVAGVEDAIAFLLAHRVDALYIEDVRISRRSD